MGCFARIMITADDRDGLARDLATAAAEAQINMDALHIETTKSLAFAQVKAFFRDEALVEALILKLKDVPDVRDVQVLMMSEVVATPYAIQIRAKGERFSDFFKRLVEIIGRFQRDDGLRWTYGNSGYSENDISADFKVETSEPDVIRRLIEAIKEEENLGVYAAEAS